MSVPVLVDQGQSCPLRPPSWGHVTRPKDIFDLSDLGVRGITEMWWVEAKEAAKRTAMHRTAHSTKDYTAHVSVVLR